MLKSFGDYSILEVFGGWIVKFGNGGSAVFVADPAHAWAEARGAPPPPPVPMPTPIPVPAPAPNPMPTVDTPEVVFEEKLATGWVNRSWAPTSLTDPAAHGGAVAISADLDDFKGLNLNGPTRQLADYSSVSFWCKAMAAGQTFRFGLYDGTNPLGNGVRVTPTTEYKEYRYTLAELGAALVGTFTNLVWEGAAFGQRDAFKIDDVVLWRRAVPAVAPPAAQAPQVLSAPTTAGALTLSADGKFINEAGEVWFGKGVNFIDFNQSNAAASVPLSRMLPEMKKRLDFAKSELKIDFIRYCIDMPTKGVIGGGAEYVAALKDIITYAWTQHGMRALLSLWNESSLEASPSSSGKFSQGPTAASVTVWQYLAQAFAHSGHVMLGLANEPESTNAANIERWRTQMVACGKVIRDMERTERGKAHIVVAQGGAYSRNLQQWKQAGLAIAGPVAYEYHDYQHENAWESAFVQYARAGMPLLIGEWGPAVIQKPGNVAVRDSLDLADSEYWSLPREQEKVFALFKQHSIPCAAWALAIRCWPDLLIDNSNGGAGVGMTLQLSPWGELLRGLYTA